MAFLHLTPPPTMQLLPPVSGVTGSRRTDLALPERADRRALLTQGFQPAFAGYEGWKIRSCPIIPGGAVIIGLADAQGRQMGVLGVATTCYGMHALELAMGNIHLRHYGQEIKRQGHRIGEQWLSTPRMPALLPWVVLALSPEVANSAPETEMAVELGWVLALSALAESDLFDH